VARNRLARESLNAALIAVGVMSAGMGLKGFLLSSGFIDGGVTGISMLLAKTTGVPLSVLLPAINLPFVVVGYRLLGRAFAIRSVLGIASLAGVLATVPFPDVTPDLTLTAVFGGFFLGAGIGLAVRGGAVLDGTEIAALVISRRADVLRVGDVILGFNVVLFLAAMSALGVRAGALLHPHVSGGGEDRSISSCTASTSTPPSRSCRRRPRASARESPPTSAGASRSTRATAA
jgi:uncharacterized membrane-anchored protein YitT (DUF2179 family)